MRPTKSHSVFTRCAKATSRATGRPWAFILACTLIVVWLLSGPFFQYSDTWQLVINTSTTIITFLMVFLIQSTQNRDASALHLKLDELIRATSEARDDLVALEQMSDAELESLEKDFEKLRGEARRIRREKRDSKNPGGT